MGRTLKAAACSIAGLAVAATIAVTVPTEAATRCDVTFKTYNVIKQGSTGAQAKAMECLLRRAGFDTTVNGRFSAADAPELAKFRKSIGLKPLSIGGRRAWSALLSQGTTPHLNKGDKGKNVLRLQLALRSAGFAKVPTTGRHGSATVAVIKFIQKSRHLKRTGEVNAAFWKALQAGKTVIHAPRPGESVSYIKMSHMAYAGARRPG